MKGMKAALLEMRRKVGTSNVGADGKLTSGSMIDIMQDCSIFQLGTIEILSKYFRDYNTGIYLVSRQLDISRYPGYGEDLTARTWIFDCNKLYGYRNTVVYDEKGNVCAASYSIGAFVDLASGKPVCVPKEVAAKVPLEGKYPMDYLPRKITAPSVEAAEDSPVSVRKYHLDYNNHVNNSKYVSIAEEFLPDGFQANRIRVEYKTPAKYKDLLIPRIFLPNERTCIVELLNDQKKTFAVVEFGR